MKIYIITLCLLITGCGIRGYRWAGEGSSAGDVTHASDSGARVVVPQTYKVAKIDSNGNVAVVRSCDGEFQKHVYNPERLIHIQECAEVTGTVVDATHGKRKDGARHEADGDNHSWLKLDKEYENLLNDGNRKFEEGNLVFELQCLYPVTQADAKASCQGWKNPLKLPPVGAHVRMWGTLVRETNHGKWVEQHPVTGWELIK